MLIFLLSMLPFPASAAYEWDNNITVGEESMTWAYTERYSGDRSIVFKNFIDVEFGDNNSFVSAWELLKADVETSKSFLRSIKGDMDVMIDNSSRNVTVLRVETDMSHELIGSVNEASIIVNNYEVFYDISSPLTESGSKIWFQGEPGSDLIINLPSDIEIISTDGIDKASTRDTSAGTRIKGKFGVSGEVLVYFSVVEGPSVEENINATENSSATFRDTGTKSLIERIFPGISDNLLEKLYSDKLDIF